LSKARNIYKQLSGISGVKSVNNPEKTLNQEFTMAKNVNNHEVK